MDCCMEGERQCEGGGGQLHTRNVTLSCVVADMHDWLLECVLAMSDVHSTRCDTSLHVESIKIIYIEGANYI